MALARFNILMAALIFIFVIMTFLSTGRWRVTPASTITRVFRVWMSAGWEVVGGKVVAAE
jgi:hypothetical protein